MEHACDRSFRRRSNTARSTDVRTHLCSVCASAVFRVEWICGRFRWRSWQFYNWCRWIFTVDHVWIRWHSNKYRLFEHSTATFATEHNGTEISKYVFFSFENEFFVRMRENSLKEYSWFLEFVDELNRIFDIFCRHFLHASADWSWHNSTWCLDWASKPGIPSCLHR